MRAWLDNVAVPFAGNECLTFPFARSKEGYGHISDKTYGTALAHVYVLDRTKGSKPTETHEGCHSCGKGHEGCVNPNHLYWGTRAQNMADRKTHGVFVPPPFKPGDANGNHVLSEAQAFAIKMSRAKGVDLADAYGVSPSTVSAIRTGRLWSHMGLGVFA